MCELFDEMVGNYLLWYVLLDFFERTDLLISAHSELKQVVSTRLFWFYLCLFLYNGVYYINDFSLKHSEHLSDSNTEFF